MNILVKIQSTSDVITNSSSEIFMVKDSRPTKELKELLDSVGVWWNDSDEEYKKLSHKEQLKYNRSSGMGGDLSVFSWEDIYQQWLESEIPKSKHSKATPEAWSLHYEQPLELLKQCVWVDVDYNRTSTIQWILDNLNVIAADGGYFEKDSKTGKIIRQVSYDEYSKLPKERQYNYYQD